MAIQLFAMNLEDLLYGKGPDPADLDAHPLDFADLDDLELPPPSPADVTVHNSSGPTSAGGGSSGATGSALAPTPTARRRGAANFAAAEAADKDQANKERVRAKNRRAQARYREKQKAKKAETEDAVQRATEELERLRTDNAAMLEHNDIMESFLTVRDHSAELLDRSAQMGAATMQPAQMAAAQLALDRLRGVELEKDPKYGWKIDEVDGEGRVIDTPDEPPCPFLIASYSEIKVMLRSAAHDGIKLKHRFICETLGTVLTQLDDPSASDAVKEGAGKTLEAALWESGAMCFETAVSSPNTMHKILAGSVGLTSQTAQEVARWACVTSVLKLSTEQRQELQPLRNLFLARAARIANNRRRILASLAAAVPEAPADGDGMASLAVLQDSTRSWLALHEATQELEENMMEEHVAVMELLAVAFGMVLTPLQKARALVASYPQFPDMFAIATIASVQEKAAVEASS